MSVSAIVGAQWGDEGKGKFVDILAQDAELVIRYNGGNNAGHTIVNEYGTFKLHLIPSGAFHPQAICIIGPGVVLDIASLVQEMREFEASGIDLKNRFFISPRCHLIMPYHRALDRLYEEAKGRLSTGTTGRGIGPAYADKAGYNGLRLSDMARRSVFTEKLGVQVSIKNRLITALGGQTMSAEQIATEFLEYYAYLQPYVRETFDMVQDYIRTGRNILLEGAQAALLDPDWGTYPFVTGSTTLVSAATAGAGVAPRAIDRIIGVAKAYTTRVGNGPFPTELTDQNGEKIRKVGAEYGTTTGRPRRCGWFDAESVRVAAAVSGFTEIAITKLDVFDDFDEIQLATGYEWGGKPAHYYDGDAVFLEECRPVYESWKGWKESIGNARAYEELPENARRYIARMEEVIGLPVSFIGVGPRREETIVR